MYNLEFTFGYQTIDAKDILYSLDKICPKVGLNTENYSKAHQIRDAEQFDFLNLSGDILTDISSGSIANCNHDALFIETKGIGLERLMRFCELLIQDLSPIQAFLHNSQYYYWQNAKDVMLYESEGIDHSTLPKKSNGLPFPLEATVIDISKNPGRFVLREGYREVVSSPMWLSTSMVKDVQALKESGYVITEALGMFRIDSPFMPFDSSEGKQADMQNKLRSVVYGI